MKITVTCFGITAAALMAAHASAQLISYEGFNYADGHDIGSTAGDTGAGWAGDWGQGGGNGGPGRLRAIGGGFGYTDGNGNVLLTSGNYGLVDFNGLAADDAGGGGNAQYFRNMDLSGLTAEVNPTMTDVVAAGDAYYISFIGERRGVSDPLGDFDSDPNTPDTTAFAPNDYARNAHFTIAQGNGYGEAAVIGNPSNKTTDNWTLRAKNTSANDVVSSEQFSYNQQFVVVKVTVGQTDIMLPDPAFDQIDVWLNPILTSEGLAGAPDMTKLVIDNDSDVFDLAQTGVALAVGSEGGNRSGGVMAFDELRVGLDWGSVTPVVPEPASLALVGLGGLGLAARRRR